MHVGAEINNLGDKSVIPLKMLEIFHLSGKKLEPALKSIQTKRHTMKKVGLSKGLRTTNVYINTF